MAQKIVRKIITSSINVKNWSKTLLEDIIGKCLPVLWIGNDLLKSSNHTGKDKFTYIKINSWLPKDTIKGVKSQETQYENVTHIANLYLHRMYEEFLKINRKRQKTKF